LQIEDAAQLDALLSPDEYRAATEV
jgi:hypothetical protein